MQTIKPNYSDMNIPTSHRPLTRYERIMQEMTVEKMADLKIRYDDACGIGGLDGYDTDAGRFSVYEDAIQAETEYLKGVEP